MKSLTIAASMLALAAKGQATELPDPDSFEWDSIEPTRHLVYHACYERFECARLQVPLDWLDANNTNTVAIAMVKLPATVPETDPTHGGSVLVNPGGPGGSGVGLTLSFGDHLQMVMDTPGVRHHDVVGFDPRGVRFTTPPADCYNHDLLARGSYAMQVRGLGGLIPVDRPRLSRRRVMTDAYGRVCGDEVGGDGGILAFASTASVARDMVEMVDRIEELREREEKQRRQSMASHQHPMGGGDEDGAGSEKKGPARLQYFGFSYGTVLGNTFASMFPGRVGRVVLDGVCDMDDYTSGLWSKNLQDSELIVDAFFETCYKAEACALKRPSDTSWHDISARFEIFLKEVEANPISIVTDTSINFVTDEDFKAVLLLSLYNPNAAFPGSAMLFDMSMRGDYSLLEAIIGAQVALLRGSCPINGTFPDMHVTPDAQAAVLCGDGDDNTGLSLEDWSGYFAELAGQSPHGATAWAEISFQCAGWPFRPRYRFTGPFSTPKPDPSLRDRGAPAAPLLFLSSSLDPVTPLRNAYAMAARHPGAVVVEQTSLGHSAVGSSPSECTHNIVRAYFLNGTVPEPGTVCSDVCAPYKPCAMSGMGIGGGGGGGGMFGPFLGPPHLRERAENLARLYEAFAVV